jgi:hypothetical protein
MELKHKVTFNEEKLIVNWREFSVQLTPEYRYYSNDLAGYYSGHCRADYGELCISYYPNDLWKWRIQFDFILSTRSIVSTEKDLESAFLGIETKLQNYKKAIQFVLES